MAVASARLPYQQLLCPSSDQTASRWPGQDTRSKACSSMKKVIRACCVNTLRVMPLEAVSQTTFNPLDPQSPSVPLCQRGIPGSGVWGAPLILRRVYDKTLGIRLRRTAPLHTLRLPAGSIPHLFEIGLPMAPSPTHALASMTALSLRPDAITLPLLLYIDPVPC
jgi:hypothetical protein